MKELWLVDPERDAVDRYQLSQGELVASGSFGRDDALASHVLPGLRIDLGAVFAR